MEVRTGAVQHVSNEAVDEKSGSTQNIAVVQRGIESRTIPSSDLLA